MSICAGDCELRDTSITTSYRGYRFPCKIIATAFGSTFRFIQIFRDDGRARWRSVSWSNPTRVRGNVPEEEIKIVPVSCSIPVRFCAAARERRCRVLHSCGELCHARHALGLLAVSGQNPQSCEFDKSSRSTALSTYSRPSDHSKAAVLPIHHRGALSPGDRWILFHATQLKGSRLGLARRAILQVQRTSVYGPHLVCKHVAVLA